MLSMSWVLGLQRTVLSLLCQTAEMKSDSAIAICICVCMCVCIHIPFPLLCIMVVAVMREGMWADALVQERCCVRSSLWVSERPLVPRPCSPMDGFVNLLIYYCSLIIFFCHFQIFFKILLSLFFLSSAYCIRVKRNEVLKSLYCADKHVTHLCGIQVKTEIFKFCTLCNNYFFSR